MHTDRKIDRRQTDRQRNVKKNSGIQMQMKLYWIRWKRCHAIPFAFINACDLPEFRNYNVSLLIMNSPRRIINNKSAKGKILK